MLDYINNPVNGLISKSDEKSFFVILVPTAPLFHTDQQMYKGNFVNILQVMLIGEKLMMVELVNKFQRK